MKLFRKLFSLTILATLVFACSNNSVFEDYHSFESSTWKLTDDLRYNVEITDTLSVYNVYLSVRNTPSYENMNLWLFVSSNSPKGLITNDTINCSLADKRGHWLGTGLGDMYATRHLLKEKVLFKNAGAYEFTIVHGMRKQDLEGISDIGLSIEKIENK